MTFFAEELYLWPRFRVQEMQPRIIYWADICV